MDLRKKGVGLVRGPRLKNKTGFPDEQTDTSNKPFFWFDLDYYEFDYKSIYLNTFKASLYQSKSTSLCIPVK